MIQLESLPSTSTQMSNALATIVSLSITLLPQNIVFPKETALKVPSLFCKAFLLMFYMKNKQQLVKQAVLARKLSAWVLGT